jgi:hypothetical protein
VLYIYRGDVGVNMRWTGMLSAFMGFIEPGDEVIIFEPFFDQ